MSKKINLSQDYSIENWHKEIKKVKDNGLKLKMLVIEKIISNPDISRDELNKIFFVSKPLISKWVKVYNNDGLKGLKVKKPEKRGSGKGRTKLTEEMCQGLKAEKAQITDKKWTLKMQRDYIEEEYGVSVKEQTIHARMKKI